MQCKCEMDTAPWHGICDEAVASSGVISLQRRPHAHAHAHPHGCLPDGRARMQAGRRTNKCVVTKDIWWGQELEEKQQKP